MLKFTFPGLIAATVGSTTGFITACFLVPDVAIATLIGLLSGMFGADAVAERREARAKG